MLSRQEIRRLTIQGKSAEQINNEWIETVEEMQRQQATFDAEFREAWQQVEDIAVKEGNENSSELQTALSDFKAFAERWNLFRKVS